MLHDNQPVLRGGAPLSNARVALVLLHGRGSDAEDIFGLGEAVAADQDGVAILAPNAAGHTWYPQRFLAPLADNEPYLSSALATIGRLVAEIGQDGVPPARVVLAGFSQGACLSLEYAVRHPRRYGGIVALSGAVIGPPGRARDLEGNLSETPVYLGCSDRDAHIPLASVEESAAVLEQLGGQVTKQIFSGMGHTVNADELAAFRAIIAGIAA